MIDFHTHILPGIDDGSKNMDMTRTMLYLEKEQGVNEIIATPHFYASEMSVGHFVRRRNHSLNKVIKRIYEKEDTRLPAITCGAEVYYFPGMGKSDLFPLCIEGTDLILLEMPFAQWTKDVYNDINRIIRYQRLTVILAHVERFYKFQRNKDIWNNIFELPVIAQFNAGCFKSFSKRRLAARFIKSGYPVVLGSDCHNVSGRYPNLAEGRSVLGKKLGDQILDDIDLFGERLLRDHGIEKEKKIGIS